MARRAVILRLAKPLSRRPDSVDLERAPISRYITGKLSNSGHCGPLFGKASVDSLGNSNALRQIPCSIRNPEFFSPAQGIDPSKQGIYSDRLHCPLSVSRFG